MADPIQKPELVILRGATKSAAATAAARLSPAALRKIGRPSGAPAFHPSPLLERAEVLGLLKDAGVQPAGDPKEEPLVLSPRRPFVENRGWLDFLRPLSLWGEGGTAWFMRQGEPDDYYKLDLWLHTTPGRSYLAQLRVTGGREGSWEIRGSDTSGIQTVAGGAERTIPILLYQVDLSLSLVTIIGRNFSQWGFYDLTISEM